MTFQSHHRLNQIAVSDRATLEGLTQFVFSSRRACLQTIGTTGHVESDMREGRFCAILFQAARKSLILKWRDVRVVEGARLESVRLLGSSPLQIRALGKTMARTGANHSFIAKPAGSNPRTFA